jgi:hypothetical protein
MKFRYLLEEVSNNGAKDVSSRDVEKDEILLGRGSASDILFESNYVSLSHAKIFCVGADCFIEDLNSLSGVRVNGTVVTRERLKAGDIVKLGDVSLQILYEGGVWGALEVRSQKAKEDADTVVARQLESVRLASRLPGFTIISLVLMLLTGGLFFVLPLLGVGKTLWNSGPISNNHAMIASECGFCHATPFVQVKDAQCLACHSMKDHAPAFKEISAHPNLEVRCASCHMEHNGDDHLTAHDAKTCTSCHADIKQSFSDALSPDVMSFDKHPEFSVEVQSATVGGASTKVRLSDVPALKDNSFLKLNHEIHLRELKSAKGKVRLGCRDCHTLANDFKTIEPITFERHCQSCHGLEFDDRLPEKNVPHGEADLVYKFLYAEYAKLALQQQRDPEVTKKFDFRMIPGGPSPTQVTRERSAEDFSRAFVEREARSAENQLFTKTACYLCHRVLPKELSPEVASAQQRSLFEVIKPRVPSRWMPASIFSHGAHEEMSCEECHEARVPGEGGQIKVVPVRESSLTNHVLMPGVDKCLPCHSQEGKSADPHSGQGKVRSECVMCHSYHEPQVMDFAKKRLTKDILSSTN